MSNKRKRKLINPKFQLKMIFTILAIVLVVFGVVIGGIVFTAANNKNEDSDTIKELEKVITVENDIIEAFIKYSKSVGDSKIILASKKVTDDHQKSMKTIEDHIQNLKKNVGRDFDLIIILIIIGVAQLLVLFYYILRRTHKISGPEFVMLQHLESIMNGKKPDFRGLRKTDDLKELYEKMKIVFEKKRKK